MPKRPIIARTALPDKPPDGMTSPAGATARTGEARPTSTADHGTGHDLEDAHHPPPAPRGTAVTARRRSSRFSATLVRDRAPVFRRGLSVPVSRCADRCRGPLAPRSAPSRLARPRRLRPRVRSAVGTPAHPPGRRPRRACRRRLTRRPGFPHVSHRGHVHPAEESPCQGEPGGARRGGRTSAPRG